MLTEHRPISTAAAETASVEVTMTAAVAATAAAVAAAVSRQSGRPRP